jgi:dipeptidyl aminopeptidase/acylaminoacyl peptidase
MFAASKKPTLALCLALCLSAVPAFAGDKARRVPTVDELLGIKQIFGASISPNGKWVAYTVSETDFPHDAFVTHIWLANPATGKTAQLTRGEKSAGNPVWSSDGHWLAFSSNRAGDKSQIFVISPEGGEAVQLTKSEAGVNSFAWSLDGKSIAYTAAPSNKDKMKDRKEHLGDFEVVRREYEHMHLWTIDVAEALKAPAPGTQRTKGTEFSVGGFAWSPDGSKIAFSGTLNPDLIHGVTSDIYVLNTGDNSVKKIVAQPGPDTNPRWSPDGKHIVFQSAMGKELFYHGNGRLAVVPAEGGPPRSITDDFDENPYLLDWKDGGIYFMALQKTASHLFRVDPASAKIERITGPDNLMAGSFSLTRDGQQVAFTANSPTTLNELFISDLPKFAPRALTDMTHRPSPTSSARRRSSRGKARTVRPSKAC